MPRLWIRGSTLRQKRSDVRSQPRVREAPAVSSGIAQVKALKQALTSIQSQLDSTILGQKVGLRTEVDVLNVQQSFYSARRDLARAHYSLLMAKLRLEAEAGELDEDDLTEVNTMLR